MVREYAKYRAARRTRSEGEVRIAPLDVGPGNRLVYSKACAPRTACRPAPRPPAAPTRAGPGIHLNQAPSPTTGPVYRPRSPT